MRFLNQPHENLAPQSFSINMLADLIDASSWTHEQWLMISIMVFMVLAVLVVIHRLYTLFGIARKQSYTPNLRPLRRGRHK
ncbi:MAG: hypothetical protein CMQ12_06465 [Gammaproteobacteria bacterium]|nr:hypothetical protein [Gammaproteobacteria bacterium]